MDPTNQLVTLYRCDVCQVASFATMEEAVEHEKKCAIAAAESARPQQQQMTQGTTAPPPSQPEPLPSQLEVKPQAPSSPAKPKMEMHRVKYFKCSNCKILFTDRVKARTHEATCSEPEWFSCRVCKIMRFATTGTLIEHEGVCKGPAPISRKDLPLAEEILKDTTGSQSDDSSVQIIEPPISSNKTSITTTPAQVQPVSTSLNQQFKEESEPLPSDSSALANNGDNAVQNTSTIDLLTPPKEEVKVSSSSYNSPSPPKSNFITCWTCDVCKVAHFDTFEKAVEHENQCMIDMKKKETMPPKKSNQGSNDVENLSKSRQQTSSANVVLFSPLINGNSDSPDFDQLSDCHASILQSVKLLHHPFNGSVALQCQFCCEPMSTTWTLKKMTEMLPVAMCNHLFTCENAPSEVVEYMKEQVVLILQKSPSIVGDLPLANFLKSYLESNGIVEGVINNRGANRDTRLVVLSDGKFAQIDGYERSKRGRLAASNLLNTRLIGTKKQRERGTDEVEKLPSPKRSKAVQSQHPEIKVGDMDCQMHYDDDGNSMYVGPLDGLPLLTSLLQKESRYLHPSQKLLLAQLELFKISPKLMKEANSKSLGLRCQNCITEKNGCCFMKLSSSNNLVRDLLLFGKEHVVRCVTKTKVTKQIHDAVVGGSVDELSNYCTLIANLYGLEDKKSADGRINVVLGESPTIPSGYSCPTDIDVRGILRASAEANQMKQKVDDLDEKAPAQDVLSTVPPAVAPSQMEENLLSVL